jgi:hypothetical protein
MQLNLLVVVNLQRSSSSGCHMWPQGVAEAVGKEGELEGVVTLTVVAVHRVTVREGVQHRTGIPQ